MSFDPTPSPALSLAITLSPSHSSPSLPPSLFSSLPTHPPCPSLPPSSHAYLPSTLSPLPPSLHHPPSPLAATQVTVYRLVSRNTIEERILHRAKQKDHIQKMVISGDQASSAFKVHIYVYTCVCVCVCVCVCMSSLLCL